MEAIRADWRFIGGARGVCGSAVGIAFAGMPNNLTTKTHVDAYPGLTTPLTEIFLRHCQRSPLDVRDGPAPHARPANLPMRVPPRAVGTSS